MSYDANANAQIGGDSKGRFWVGWVLSVLPALLLLFAGGMQIARPEAVVKNTTELGYHESIMLPLGIAILCCTVLYLIPRTAVLGAILLTGYLGGAVDAHVRNIGPEHSAVEILFPVIFAAILWGGLCLRSRRVCAAVFGGL